MTAQAVEIPSEPLSRRFVRYVLSFGVSVGVGLAPFLGKIKVPGFEALLELFPRQLQGTLIPLSAFLMGLVAVAIQFYSREKVAAVSIRRYFRAGFIAIVLGFFLFVVFYKLFVIKVPLDGGASHAAVVVTASRLPSCKCEKTSSDLECAERLTVNPAALATCWGGTALELRELSLMISYLLLTSGFGALIGLLILQEESQRLRRSAQRARAAPPKRTPRPKKKPS